jgi:ATP-dependent helicase/DNAse subunit B
VHVKTKLVDSVATGFTSTFEVEKSAFYFSRLNELMQNGFSATMLSTYAKCRLDFYNKYILGFKSIKDAEEIDESDIGNLVHGFFQRIFAGNENKKLDRGFFEKALNETDAVLETVVAGNFAAYNFNSGPNYLAMELVRKMVISFLNRQIKDENVSLAGKTVVGSELKIECDMSVGTHAFKLTGNIDLLLWDEQNNYFVYDFKTGRVTEDGLKFTERSQLTIDNFGQRDKLLQLLVYKILVQQKFNTQHAQPFIIPLATGSSAFLSIETGARVPEKAIEEFLEMVITEMHDKTKIFGHNEKNKFCEFCS